MGKVQRFRKKPVVVEALRWSGKDHRTMCEFLEGKTEGYIKGVGGNFYIDHSKVEGGLIIKTLEGEHIAQIGDYIIKGVNGEFYPCKPDIFSKTYEPASEEPSNVVCKDGVCELKSRLMNFGQALESVKAGQKITRKGWNGKGMFVVYQKAYPKGIPSNKQTAEAWGLDEGELFRCEPYLQIKMTNGSHSMWVPSINDVLAEDWGIV